jgi:hypothetical protein
MKFKLFGSLLIFILFQIINGQINDSQKSLSKTETDKPSVYLTFERIGKFELLCSNKHRDGVWVRLHNKTPWAINLDAQQIKETNNQKSLLRLMDGSEVNGLFDGEEVSACYDVEAVPILVPQKKGRKIILDTPLKTLVPKVDFYCNCKWRSGRSQAFEGVWIPAGNTILLSVPREALNKNLRVYTLFHYEWESSGGSIKRGEPQHKVYFYASDLPESLQ